ncbi:putative SLC26A/SulP transporter [Medicago truncatula]|uniref:Putative SLC26A/SulP transporter n=1 Tax=Medicago truncatula TaxID=3880 RepID=G7KA22_MEDTR|nr:low affinity sulfate transporter 3 [Medicago truncatula]AES97924.1 sulfate/bicarbonate/oxalate exchanger and transporter sat-1 [Medicago truncatula]RHN56058.1 putative SLC26A/SulP transporter [Medicago truncatula]
MRDQRVLHIEDSTSQIERSKWVLDSPNPPPLWKKLFSSLKETLLPHGNKLCFSSKNKSFLALAYSFLQSLFPILVWLKDYTISKFKDDLLAGLTLASLCIPQSIGYASLAKVDPQYGLYTSIVPPLIYAVMGSSRDIAIGPVAVVSMLLSSLVTNVIDPVANPHAYRDFIFTVTFFTGIFQAAFGIFRLGFLVDFLSHAALVGFMAGAAIIIGLQQLKGLLGITHFTTKTDAVSVLVSVYKSLHQQITSEEKWSPLNFVLGCSFLIFLLVTRFIARKKKKLFWLPAIAPLLSVILSTLIVYLSKADKQGINIIKHVKGGLNQSSVHQLQFHGQNVGQAAKIGLVCAVIALTEAMAVGRSFASIKGYQLDGNREMLSMGIMNIAGSLTSCYVATGSFSRTAVNFSAGCQTAVSNIVMAITVILFLQLFARLLYYTPMAILAAIILSALPGLIDINEARYIWKVDKLDFLACIGAFVGVLFASVEIGLLVAISISFAKILIQSIRPGVEILGRVPRTEAFCDVTQYPMAISTPGIVVIRISSGSLCFANANFVKERILKWVVEEDDIQETAKGNVRAIIMDMTNLMNVDTSGILALEELHKRLLSRGVELAMVNPRWLVIHKLKLAHFVDKIGKQWVFLTVGEAVDACLSSKIATA